MELLFKNSDRDAAVLAEARVFSAVLEKYLLKFHSLDAKHFLVPPNLGESNYRFRMPRVESELMFFGQFSDDEPHIAAANPGLEGEKRIRFIRNGSTSAGMPSSSSTGSTTGRETGMP